MKRNTVLREFFRAIPAGHQPLVFAIVAGLTLKDLISDLRSEIIYLMHFDTSSIFLIQAGSSIGSVTRPLLDYALKAMTLFLCAFVIRKGLSSPGEVGKS